MRRPTHSLDDPRQRRGTELVGLRELRLKRYARTSESESRAASIAPGCETAVSRNGKTNDIHATMRFDIITIFPEAFESYVQSSIIGRALRTKRISVHAHNLRQWTADRHKTVDDKPYGGGPGMVMKVEPLAKAVKAITANRRTQNAKRKKSTQRIILLSAKGKLFTQQHARRLARFDRLIFICGHYEGVDERVAKHIADEELSIGEYVLTGGELPALVVVDAVTRLIPGVLGKQESLAQESFSIPGTREYPHYTRPEVFRMKSKKGKPVRAAVPKILLSGDHKAIARWRSTHAKSGKSAS